jgi:hypothetical protein
MNFKASLREIDNGFLVKSTPLGHETYDKTIVEALTTILLAYDKWSTPAIPPKAPEEALKEPSEAAIKYTKLSGLIHREYIEFLTQFVAKFPGEDIQEALVAANCKLVDGKVTFVGGA